MTKPLISVIIPVFNGEKYIDEAMDSVLAQKYLPIEIIIINDGSTDNTQQHVKQFMVHHPIHYVFQDNQGLAVSRNVGLSFAKGEYIAFIDADDIWVENKLESQIEVMRRDPTIEMVSGRLKQFISQEIPSENHKNYQFHPGEVQSNLMGCALIRRSVFDKYGLFDPKYHIGQDMDWFLRAKEKGIIIEALPQLVYYRRLHQNNIGRNRTEESYKNRFKILKQVIDLRRDNKT